MTVESRWREIPTSHPQYQACVTEIAKMLHRRWLIVNNTGKQAGLYPCAEVLYKDIALSAQDYVYVNCLLLESGWAMMDQATVPEGWEPGYRERMEKARAAQRGLWASTSPAK